MTPSEAINAEIKNLAHTRLRWAEGPGMSLTERAAFRAGMVEAAEIAERYQSTSDTLSNAERGEE